MTLFLLYWCIRTQINVLISEGSSLAWVDRCRLSFMCGLSFFPLGWPITFLMLALSYAKPSYPHTSSLPPTSLAIVAPI